MPSPASGYLELRQTSLAYVSAMKVGHEPGCYAKERGAGASLYGSYHAAHVLDLFGELERFDEQERAVWARAINQRQADDGFFTNDPALLGVRLDARGLNRVWHWTRGCVWTLRLLGARPPQPLHFLVPFENPENVRAWIASFDWSYPWAASNQVLAFATALFAHRDWFGADIGPALERGLRPALASLLDPATGLWGTQFGAGVADGIFGNIHLLPIYFALGWPVPYVERMIDATLAAQLPDGSYWPGGSDCPDFDGAYMLANLSLLTAHRRTEVDAAARRYLAHALLHRDPQGCGWLLHRRDTLAHGWKSRPHWIWPENSGRAVAEYRDEDLTRTHIMLGSWFYPLSVALIAQMLGDTGYEGPYRINGESLHQCNVFNGTRRVVLCGFSNEPDQAVPAALPSSRT